MPLVSLVGIWAFAATITIQSGVQLLRIKSVYDDMIVPARAATTHIQQERYLSLLYLGSTGADHAALEEQRVKTDQARANLERLALTPAVRESVSAPLVRRVEEFVTVMRRLPEIRARVDARSFTRLLALDAYRLMSDAANRVYDKIQLSNDASLGEPTRAITLIGRSRDLMNEQASMLAGVVSAGVMTGEERTAFTAMVTKRRLLYDMGFQLLDDELRQPYLDLQTSPAFARYAAIEDQVTKDVRPGRPLPGSAGSWGPTVQNLNILFDRQAGVASERIAGRAAPIANRTLWQIGVAAGLGLVAVAASLFVSVRFGRRITAELVELQRAALELARQKLPAVVRRLREGEDVDVAAESPPITTGTTQEIVSVGHAFTSVQTTAIEAAVGQAEIRKGVNKVFLNLARRNQSLLHRQLSMLDSLERRVTDPELLEDLFGIDHLTTRMRRHAEGLIILSGAVPGRGWRNPVPLYDVVRAAVEEVEDYLRVHVAIPENMALSGQSTTDVIHLLAELVENATIYSPPQTQVEVRGELVARGFVIEVEDRGLGMSPEELADINQRLARPPEFDLADSDRLGLFVVGRLAARRGIRVSLRPSPYGGTTAIVLIPDGLVRPSGPPQPPAEPVAALEAGPKHGTPALSAGGPANGAGRTHAGASTAQDPSLAGTAVNGSGSRHSSASVLDDTPSGRLRRNAGRHGAAVPAPADGETPADAPGTEGTTAGGPRNRAAGAVEPAKGEGRAAGLPHRVRQANLAPQLRGAARPGSPEREPSHAAGAVNGPRPGAANGAGESAGEEPTGPSPDMFSSFRAGWQRAREGEGDTR
ncbi:nitrate- and nitrite sensing domain-containing protein [Sphaerisporangium sp. TRM90804]|uniref:sensor histidine kinase n=1 Tax=Sphaerisporangium sp. TRM90804 TaxID=3031113 RepID=UPI002447F574|nr:nitrate- and nitrite sensing domain-containing protein [Sphaerisporangium sp. TRM90804]MDH2428923.1 nitrate- and nitrite sensing domain-containing protein [Sphaerisporangium sp. TRM90804]